MYLVLLHTVLLILVIHCQFNGFVNVLLEQSIIRKRMFVGRYLSLYKGRDSDTHVTGDSLLKFLLCVTDFSLMIIFSQRGITKSIT